MESSVTAPPCARPRQALVTTSAPVGNFQPVVAVAHEGLVRLVAKGMVLGVLDGAISAELISCMAEGWRYTGTLEAIDGRSAHVMLEARRLL